MLDTARAWPVAAGSDDPVLPLRAAGVRVEAGGRALLEGIDLVLEPGRRTVVLGPNGAGKTLLLGVLQALVRPTAGTVTWAGRLPDERRRLRQAYVQQRPVLLRRSALANIEHALAAKGVGRRERRELARAALAAARLSPLAAMPARLLSGGEQQRLALARALALAPEVLYLDEPTASLDPASTLAVEELIAGAAAAGTRIVLVTHDKGQARRHADEIVFMQAGRIVETGPADIFFIAPRTEAARAYLEGRIHLDPRPPSRDGTPC
ncbi:ATP-binding cassette domain-containing protein [Prosthecomicrobium sp. N25]|uniref:ATP-binding cassette domain-containing protein n=1 Tax=Prosthecomicrobium sp. N25 TaxID=3129254 RepID=UPI00307737BA